VGPALDLLPRRIPVVDVVDPLADASRGGVRLGEVEYEALLAEGDAAHEWSRPAEGSRHLCEPHETQPD
jgi:fatty-acyl-CoA synthase